ncbi:MAG TPA: hypothetical protein VIW70_07970 [Rubrivivax sp.]
MRYLVLIAALAMPLISWLSQREVFGPDNATLSARYPTLLIAAGYAFAVWGLLFALDVVFGAWQAFWRRKPRGPDSFDRVRVLAAAGFALTAAWMIVFSMQLFWVALLVIWGALACLVGATFALERNELSSTDYWLARVPLSMHAGWLSLAAFLNTAQVIVAFRLLSTTQMLGWTLVLWLAAAVLLVAVQLRLRGNAFYAATALWGLIGVYVQQSRSSLEGAPISAWVAAGLGCALLALTAYLIVGRRRRDDNTAMMPR